MQELTRSFTIGLVVALASGRESVPRRWAVHFPEWAPYDRVATLFAILVIAAALVLTARFPARAPRMAAAI